MSARDELADLIAKTNQKFGRDPGAMKQVTPEEMLRLWRNNPAFRSLIGPAADALLERYDREERDQEKAQRPFQSYWAGINVEDLIDDLLQQMDHNRFWREQYQQRWAGAFIYGTSYSNPFAGRPHSHAQQFTGRGPAPQDPERVRAIEQARKIKALADDHRGNPHQRKVAADKLATLRTQHSITDMELR